MSNSLDPDQDQHSVGPDLSPNCLQRLVANDLVVKELTSFHVIYKNIFLIFVGYTV